MNTWLRAVLLAVVISPLVGHSPLTLAADPKPATAETLRELEGEFMKEALSHGSQGFMSYYAEDAVELPNGAHAIQGKANIAKTMGFLDNKDNQLTWTPIYADISASGDLGYTYGTFEFRYRDKDGEFAVSHGKYTSIWKKQKDGSWKVVLDMGNENPAPGTKSRLRGDERESAGPVLSRAPILSTPVTQESRPKT